MSVFITWSPFSWLQDRSRHKGRSLPCPALRAQSLCPDVLQNQFQPFQTNVPWKVEDVELAVLGNIGTHGALQQLVCRPKCARAQRVKELYHMPAESSKPCCTMPPHPLSKSGGDSQDSEGRALWDMTWHKARSISSGLTPQLLVTSGLDRPDRPEPRGAAAGGPGPGAPPSSPSPSESHQAPLPAVQHAPPANVEEAEGRPVQQATSASMGASESSSQRAQDSQLQLGANQEGANQEGGKAFTTAQPGSSFPEGDSPQASFSRTDRQTEASGSAADQAGSSGDQPQPSQPAVSSQLHTPQEAATSQTPSDALPAQSSRQDPPRHPSEPQRLERLSPSHKLDIHTTMSSEPSSHKLSALEQRYATGVPLTADEAFNRALQQQTQRANSWGSNTSAPGLTDPSSLSAAAPAVGDLPDRVSSSRLLATIHSGIPSTDDDGPLFAELGKLVAEEEAEAGASGQGRGQDEEVDLNQVGCLQVLRSCERNGLNLCISQLWTVVYLT